MLRFVGLETFAVKDDDVHCDVAPWPRITLVNPKLGELSV